MTERAAASPGSSRPVRRRPPIERAAGAGAGIAAVAAAISTGELIAGLIDGAPSPVVAVGSLVIALQPPGAKDVMVGLFGTNDKLALNLLVLAVALAVGAIAGIRALSSWTDGAVIVALLAGVALVASLAEPQGPAVFAFAGAIVAAGVGIGVLRWLVGMLAPAGRSSAKPAAGSDRPGAEPPRPEGAGSDGIAAGPPWSRRRFLAALGSLAVGSLAAGLFGRWLLVRSHPELVAPAASLPPLGSAVPPLAPDQSLAAPGITPIVMPTDRFYRIDTELLVPQVDASTWHLDVSGMVEHPISYTYAQILRMPQIEQYVTIACVSNQVGGNLVGNALWRGVRLKEILAAAGVQSGATQIVGRSVDGFTVGFPTTWALDPAREPMVVVGMNGGTLPPEHGYPARLIVPGLYGYVSATKWLSQIELTTREAFDAYWIQLGWAKDGPILTQSRIDHPGDGENLAAGPNWIDGLAWAPDRGVSKVEVSIDGGPWRATQTSRPISKATWVQWMLPWDATPGSHTIEVRATDGTGAVQTAEVTPPSPDGARGHDRVTVTVG